MSGAAVSPSRALTRAHTTLFDSVDAGVVNRSGLGEDEVIRGVVSDQGGMGIACRQGRSPAAGRNVGDWPGSVSALAGDGPKALIDMRVAGDHKIHFGLMKKWQVSAMPPPRGM